MASYPKSRRSARVKAPPGLWATWHTRSQTGVSPVVTLGLDGLFLAAGMPALEGEVVEVLLNAQGGIQIKAVARDSRPEIGMGLEFITTGPGDLTRLRKLVADLLLESQIEHPRRLRLERVSKIIARATPLPLRAGMHTVLHVIPMEPVDIGDRFESMMRELHQKGQLRAVFSAPAFNSSCDSDGYLIYGESGKSLPLGSYLFVSRNGLLESVNTFAPRDPVMYHRKISLLDLEACLLKEVPGYLMALKRLDARPPIILGLTVIGCSGYSLEAAPSVSYRPNKKIASDTLLLPDVAATSFDCDLSEVLKPLFDALWRAASESTSDPKRLARTRLVLDEESVDKS